MPTGRCQSTTASRFGLAPRFSRVRRTIQTIKAEDQRRQRRQRRRPRTAPRSGSRGSSAPSRPCSRGSRELLVLDDRLLDVEPALGDALEVVELDLLGPLVQVGVALDRRRPACRTPSGPRRARRWPRPRPPWSRPASSLSNFLAWLRAPRACGAWAASSWRLTNDSSPASTSTQLSTNGTLSNSRFSILRRRISKNCSPIMSRSAIAITLIFAGFAAASRPSSSRRPSWRSSAVGRDLAR